MVDENLTENNRYYNDPAVVASLMAKTRVFVIDRS